MILSAFVEFYKIFFLSFFFLFYTSLSQKYRTSNQLRKKVKYINRINRKKKKIKPLTICFLNRLPGYIPFTIKYMFSCYITF